MKLSEAIREGAKIRPQAFGAFYHLVDGAIRSCAIGAAFEAAGFYKPEELQMPCHLDDRAYLFDGIPEEWATEAPKILCTVEDCDACYAAPAMAGHFNDDHRWTRERVADWLEENGY